MAQDRDDFLRRWSRRKQVAAAQGPAPKPAADAPAPKLPSIDSLTFESDFKDFMHAKVEESVKRAALKKLFSDPRFNIMDGLDVYIDDYSQDDPIPQAMLAKLEHAKATLFGREEDKPPESAQPEKPEVAQAPAEATKKKEDDGAAG
ncbi:MAG TPA: DUF3306 domain-containing protein [Burkholderiales bacterium]|nr:DUF3306 domain-containing protein [Burkholderiales bacterium]